MRSADDGNNQSVDSCLSGGGLPTNLNSPHFSIVRSQSAKTTETQRPLSQPQGRANHNKPGSGPGPGIRDDIGDTASSAGISITHQCSLNNTSDGDTLIHTDTNVHSEHSHNIRDFMMD